MNKTAKLYGSIDSRRTIMKSIKELGAHDQDLIKTIKSQTLNGDPIYTVLRSVSRSGMMRKIDVYIIKDNKPLYLNCLVLVVLVFWYYILINHIVWFCLIVLVRIL